MARPQQTIESFYPLLVEGRTDPLVSIFAGEPAIDTPLGGAIRGKPAFERFVREQQAWLAQRDARPSLLASTVSAERAVAEFVLDLKQDGRDIDLPVAVVADVAAGKFSALRVYHSTWPLTGEHAVRGALLDPAHGLEEPEVVERYMAALATGDKEAILALFTEDAYLREPSGARYRHSGSAGRRAFYDLAMAGGGVPLKHCTATFDGKRFAVEYVCDEWGPARFAPQAGMAVYDLAAGGRLAAVRIYDDVSPPGETHAS